MSDNINSALSAVQAAVVALERIWPAGVNCEHTHARTAFQLLADAEAKLQAHNEAEVFDLSKYRAAPGEEPQQIALTRTQLPKAHDGCKCQCHVVPGIMHCVPCCHPTSNLVKVTIAQDGITIKDAT